MTSYGPTVVQKISYILYDIIKKKSKLCSDETWRPLYIGCVLIDSSNSTETVIEIIIREKKKLKRSVELVIVSDGSDVAWMQAFVLNIL